MPSELSKLFKEKSREGKKKEEKRHRDNKEEKECDLTIKVVGVREDVRQGVSQTRDKKGLKTSVSTQS